MTVMNTDSVYNVGLNYLQGWRHDEQNMRMGLAREWPDRWWAHALGPHAFVVESDLAPPGATDDDTVSIASLTKVAGCMERELHLAERPSPDLMTAFASGGIVLANIHPEPLRDATDAQAPGSGHTETGERASQALQGGVRSVACAPTPEPMSTRWKDSPVTQKDSLERDAFADAA